MIRTIPSGADVKLVNEKGEQKDKVTTDTHYKMEHPKDFFLSGKYAKVLLVMNKEGYKPHIVSAAVVKGEDNEDLDIIKLEPLDTEISFETNPPGARIRFFPDRNSALSYGKEGENFLPKEFVPLPPMLSTEEVQSLKRLLDVEKTFDIHVAADSSDRMFVKHITTPFSERYTEKTVRDPAVFRPSYVIRIDKEDYLSQITEIDIRPGKSNTFSYQLKPFHTEVKIVSEPDGVEVEDKRMGGFGYLGKTPLIRTFSYQESHDKAVVDGDRLRLLLTLKAAMPGYEDEYQDVKIDLGEKTSLRFQMRVQPKEITFQSDPPETNVYVRRETERQVFDEATRALRTVPLEHWKHLGTTPFTYYMDPADPLMHNDRLRFSKPGYVDCEDTFKSGVTNYHKVLEPKGSVQHRGVIQ